MVVRENVSTVQSTAPCFHRPAPPHHRPPTKENRESLCLTRGQGHRPTLESAPGRSRPRGAGGLPEATVLVDVEVGARSWHAASGGNTCLPGDGSRGCWLGMYLHVASIFVHMAACISLIFSRAVFIMLLVGITCNASLYNYWVTWTFFMCRCVCGKHEAFVEARLSMI